jgi:hypothetical protein
MIRRSRHWARRVLIGAALGACSLSLPASASALVEPIVGTWDSEGAQIQVVPTPQFGFGHFQGTVVGGSFGACNKGGVGTVAWKQLGGGGFGYDGKIPFVHSNDCSSAGDGPATFSLSSRNSGTWSATSPGDGMTYTGSMTRVGTFDIAAIVENIRQQIAGPCDYEKLQTNPDACGKSLGKDPRFWNANGSLICGTGTALSGSGKGTVVTTPLAVNDCLQSLPAPKRQARLSRGGGVEHSALARVKAGTYSGVSVSLVQSGQAPKKKKIRRRARSLAAFLASHKKPHKSNPISFKVGKGRATTFSSRLTLTCEDGSSQVVDLNNLPDPTAPLSVPRRGYFTLAAEDDPLITARIGGYFLAKRSLAGSLYVGAHVDQHGICESWVAYAARKG